MPFIVRMGLPEMEAFWQDLRTRYKNNTLSKNDLKLFKKFYKAIHHLSINPQHSGLSSHEIDELSTRYSKYLGKKIKVFQSYLENKTPSAGRLYWCYAPQKNHITIIGLEPHPEDKKRGGYSKVKLSNLPPIFEDDQ